MTILRKVSWVVVLVVCAFAAAGLAGALTSPQAVDEDPIANWTTQAPPEGC